MTEIAHPNPTHEQANTDSGVDRTLLEWMASKTPEERLQTLQSNVNAIVRARNARKQS